MKNEMKRGKEWDKKIAAMAQEERELERETDVTKPSSR